MPSPKLIPPAGQSKSIFQPRPATVDQKPILGAAPTTSSGKSGKSESPNSGKSPS
jgi:hypothetical protein